MADTRWLMPHVKSRKDEDSPPIPQLSIDGTAIESVTTTAARERIDSRGGRSKQGLAKSLIVNVEG